MASTPPVVNNAEEAMAIRRLLGPTSSTPTAPSPRILLVTSAFHMRRSQRLFERQGMQVLPFPVDFQARGPVRSGVIPPSGCPVLQPWRTPPEPCGNCWGGWWFVPGKPDS
jgi:hypothetical protein